MTHDLLEVLYFFVPAYAANMAPVLVQGVCPTWAIPMDGGHTFRGRRILGDHKTWRGLLAGVLAGVVVFALQQLAYRAGLLPGLALVDYAAASLLPGVLLGLGAGVGDAVKSFFKRQIGIAPGGSWLGFDQLDFMVGAYALVALVHVPPLVPFLLCLPVVFAGSVATTGIGYAIGMKEAWI